MDGFCCNTIIPTSTVPTFTKFSELATELRLKIWGFALGPRILRIDPEWRRLQERVVFRFGWLPPEELLSNLVTHQVPTIFHVCQESRMVGLETYYRSRHTSDKAVDVLYLTETDLEFLAFCLRPNKDDDDSFESMLYKFRSRILKSAYADKLSQQNILSIFINHNKL
jgi:hypothetical protein